MNGSDLVNEEKILSQINERQLDMSVYDILKSSDQKAITLKVLEDAIMKDIRCILLVPGGMEIEGMPKLSKQELEDIKIVADTIFLDQVFAGLPAERRTEVVSQAAVIADPSNLEYVPKNVLQDDFILNLLCMDGELIYAVNKDRRTPEMYAAALENTGFAIKFFPDELITRDVAMKAVENNGMALEFVPKEIRTKDVCRAALDNFPYSLYSINNIINLVPFSDVCMEHLGKMKDSSIDPLFVFGNINPKLVTKEMAELVVEWDSECFQLVPNSLKSQELCIKAVSADWLNMRFVPEKMKTKQVCDAALNHSFHALPYFPEKLKTNEYLMDIIKNEGHAIRYVAPEKLTHEMCEESIKTAKSAYIVQYIPYSDVCLNLLRKCPDCDQVREFMMNIKPTVIDHEIAKELINKLPSLIQDLPDHVKDQQLYMQALELDAKVLRYLPDNYKIEELCRSAIRRDGEAITGIPESLRNHDFYMEMVKENGANLKYIPREHREKDICQVALDHTNGIDKEKLHIISHIPHSDICLNVIKSNKNPETIMEIMMYMDKGVINKDMAKEVVSMDAQTIKYIPDSLKTKEICREAVFSKPDVLGWIPEYRRTPEMCLLAVKSHSYLENLVPADVLDGDNIFTFSRKLEDEIPGTKKLNYEQVLKLYNKEELSVKGLHLGNQTSDEQSLQYLNDKVVIKGIGTIQEKQDTLQEIEKQAKRNGLKL